MCFIFLITVYVTQLLGASKWWCALIEFRHSLQAIGMIHYESATSKKGKLFNTHNYYEK